MLRSVENGLNLPALRANPFKTQPLGKDESELLVGRDEQVKMLSNYVRFASPRVVGLVGEKGSGRTSLINVVASTSDHVHTVFWPRQDEVTTILHQMYIDLMKDFDTPPVHSVLIDRLEAELAGRTGLLPVIIFDHPHLPGNELAEVLTQLMPVLNRIRALTIISLTPGQKSGFPEELLGEMDLTLPLEPLNREEIGLLVNRRVSKSSRSSWTAPPALLDMVLEETSGHANRAVKLLRDVVDASRGMPLADGREINLSIFVKQKPKTDVGDGTFKRVAQEAQPVNDVKIHLTDDEQSSTVSQDVSAQSEQVGGNASQESDHPAESAPASRQDVRDGGSSSIQLEPLEGDEQVNPIHSIHTEPSVAAPAEDEIEFDPAQFPSLEDSAEMWGEEPLEEPEIAPQSGEIPSSIGEFVQTAPSNSNVEQPTTNAEKPTADIEPPLKSASQPEVSDSSDQSSSAMTAEQWREELRDEQGGAEVIEMEPGSAPAFGGGRFGGLRTRNKTAKMQLGADKHAGAPRNSGPMEAKPNQKDADDANLHQVNFNDRHTMLWVQDGVESPYMGDQATPSQEAPNTPSQQPINPTRGDAQGGRQGPPQQAQGSAHARGETLTPYDAHQGGQAQIPHVGREVQTDVISALSNLRRPEPPSRVGSNLNVEALTNLADAEIRILEQATEREVSPSDEYLQKELAVGRPRLSQLFNKLLKDGILTVRKEGRTRLFRISQTAAEHLISLHAGGES